MTSQPSSVLKPPYGANSGEWVPSSPGSRPDIATPGSSVPRLASPNSSSDADTRLPVPVRSRSM